MPDPETAPPRRTRLDAAVRRRQVIDAALQLFAERPFAEVSTADIAAAAGITRANLHYHFGTKRELYVEVVKNFARLPPLPPARRERGSLQDEVEHMISRWLDTVWRNRGTFITIFEAGPLANDAEIERTLESGREAWAARLAEMLGLPGGATPPARALVRSFQAMAETAVDEWLRRKRLTREDVFLLLSQSLLAVARAVAPTVLHDTPG